MKPAVIIASLLIAIGLGAFILVKSGPAKRAESLASKAVVSSVPDVIVQNDQTKPGQSATNSMTGISTSTEVIVPSESVASAAPLVPARPSVPGVRPGRELRDPLAREALSLVGLDRDAENYWAEAIFDTSLPDREREDLMEDLNEAGLSDPKNPSAEDMVVIANRILSIESVALDADEFMLRHLGEAYKDLVNLLNGVPPP